MVDQIVAEKKSARVANQKLKPLLANEYHQLQLDHDYLSKLPLMKSKRLSLED
jgi:hypothetical protein